MQGQRRQTLLIESRDVVVQAASLLAAVQGYRQVSTTTPQPAAVAVKSAVIESRHP